MNPQSWQRLLHRSPESNKYDYGHVLILGGSQAMIGAPVLAARAALRTGAGLATIASTHETIALIDRDIEEIMIFSLPTWNKVEQSIAKIETFIKDRHVSVLVVGPGLPAAANEMILTLLPRVRLPMILDAQAFSALSGHLPILQSAASVNKSVILTPHEGEYSRLIKNETRYLSGNTLTSIETFAKDFNVTLVLKQYHTIVVSAKGEVYQNTTGNPGLATAGAGDVLSGIMAALLAQKITAYEAAQMAVYLHGVAGDMAANAKTEPGMIASDIIELLPKALKKAEKFRANEVNYCYHSSVQD